MAEGMYNPLVDTLGADAQNFATSNGINLSSYNTPNYNLSDYGIGTPGSNSADGGLLGSLNNTLGTNMSGTDFLKGAMGIGQLGLGILSYLDQRKLADKQGQLLGQQIDTNKFLLNQAKGRQADIAKQFGAGGTQGLAANQVQAPAPVKKTI